MDQNILKSVAAEFAALDLSEENARIAEIRDEIARLECAKATAEARCKEIDQMISTHRRPTNEQENARAVADALLADRSAVEAVAARPDEVALREERTALNGAIRDLHQRLNDASTQIRAIQTETRKSLRPLVETLVESLTADAKEAAEQIANMHAALHAIGNATRLGFPGFRATGRAIKELVGPEGLVTGRRQIPVPAEIVETLQALEGKGEALSVQVLTASAIY